jgi:hypothetical protein
MKSIILVYIFEYFINKLIQLIHEKYFKMIINQIYIYI